MVTPVGTVDYQLHHWDNWFSGDELRVGSSQSS